MGHNSINWLGNPVVDGHSSYKSTQATICNACGDLPSKYDVQSKKIISVEPAQNPPMDQQGPPPVTDYSYIPGYLAKQIGKNVRAEFAIGQNFFVDRTGKLVEVGVNYFVLEDVNSRTRVMCDLYSVKFVTILQS